MRSYLISVSQPDGRIERATLPHEELQEQLPQERVLHDALDALSVGHGFKIVMSAAESILVTRTV